MSKVTEELAWVNKEARFLVAQLLSLNHNAIGYYNFVFNRFLQYGINNFVYKSRILTLSQHQCEDYFRPSAP